MPLIEPAIKAKAKTPTQVIIAHETIHLFRKGFL